MNKIILSYNDNAFCLACISFFHTHKKAEVQSNGNVSINKRADTQKIKCSHTLTRLIIILQAAVMSIEITDNLKRIDCVYRSNLKPKRNLHLQEETSWL